jgi:intraflagellar transport protein 172
MYRAHEMWEDALRVAKANGNTKELGEIAIKIAENMDGEKGTQFLIKNGLIEAAVDFEANQERFDDAFRLANNHAKYKLPEVHLKYALHLEDENRFKEAEEEFIKANKPQEAINMYEHKQDWHSALSVARQYHPESVNKVFLNQAKFYLERRDFAKSEQAYINAKEPEKAINMYQEARMYGEALRVANKHAPHLVHQINENYSRGPQAQNQSPDEILNSAKMWEESRDYNKAIDRYLEITEQMFAPDVVEEIWNSCFNLAMSYAKDRVQDVVLVLGPRLLKISRFDSAAEIYEAVGFFEKAIEAYVQCQKWDRAFECAQQVRPMEMQQMLMNKIQEQKKSMLIQGGKFGKIVESGDMSGLEMLSQRGQWEECLSLASNQGPEVLNTYLMKFSKTFLQQGQFKETARVLVRYNCPAIQQMLPVYKTISVEVLSMDNNVELAVLKEMLAKLIENLETQVDKKNPIFVEFYRYLVITHLQLMKGDCQKHKLVMPLAMLSSSLLRYTKEIRADKAYLDAGN